jgi:leader peptidase (prepilin peptidase)/N-methyltransferase
MTETLLFSIFAGLFGLIIGSFLNVCISRLPEDQSITAPRSQCPRCGSMIHWYDNIPLLSFAILGGRCRACRAHISWRYPLVELVTAALFFEAWRMTGGSWAGVKLCLFAAIAVELALSDWETRILPDEFTLWGTAAGIILAPVAPLPVGILSWMAALFAPGASPALTSLVNAAGGAALLSGGMWAMGAAYERLRGREGLGFGDVKMVAFLGAMLGLEGGLLALMFGSLIGSVVGLIWIKVGKKDPAQFELPFGTFLAVGALGVAFGAMR